MEMKVRKETQKLLMRLRKERVLGIIVVLWAVVLCSASLVLLFEREDPSSEIRTFGDAIWWSVVTIATVGYGDLVPKTTGGRIVAVGTILGGVGVLSIITATIASAFVERRMREERGLEPTKLKGHFVLCGWNHWAEEVVEGMIRHAKDKTIRLVLVNELPSEEVEEIRQRYEDHEIEFVRGNFVHENVLKRANVAGASAVIVVPDTSGGRAMDRADERTILATLAIKTLAPTTRTTAVLLDEANKPHLQRANVDEIIVRGERTGFITAGAALCPGLLEVLDGILSFEAEQSLDRWEIPERFVGRPVGALRKYLMEEKEATLVALVKKPSSFRLVDVLSHDMSAIDQFIMRKFEEANLPLTISGKRHRVRVNPKDTELIEKEEEVFVIAPRESG